MERRSEHSSVSKKSMIDLEQQIMQVWSTLEDLDTVMWAAFDREETLSEDELHNLLLGVRALHASRCEQLYSLYSNILKEQNGL